MSFKMPVTKLMFFSFFLFSHAVLHRSVMATNELKSCFVLFFYR